ncbi:small GTPase superfamily [Bisporella sp. PMI_857]|nr:small GTPase superfamily [Bisporella sp. PMI_857]
MPIEEKLPLYRLAVLGDNDVERSAFTKQLTLQHSIYSYEPTSEEPSYLQRVVIGQHACVLGVLDTAGQEGATALRGKWIREGHGFVLVYSITSRLSFVQIPRFHDQIQRVKKRANLINYPGSNLTTVSPPFCPIKLFGNNCHRSNEREVSTEEGQALAKKLGCKFVEVSTESHINENAFYDVVRDIRQHRLQAAMKEKELTRWGASL